MAGYLYSMPSCTKCSSSIATSPPPLAASVGPVHFIGRALISFQRSTGLPCSSFSVISTLRCVFGLVRVSDVSRMADASLCYSSVSWFTKEKKERVVGLGFDEIFLNYTRFYTRMLMGLIPRPGYEKS